ncbi:Rne/Rng family ribonuclease [Nonomuraea turcica]|uniref:Rne/Rng family ribonuclease n=1 Tax=Nonomuraea sp. G32 TaxID=3067274 RepID=UPI00273B75ED|nr:Rne/Rng family ribonuclease [Nonomuraea sp. G32]MDP4511902.1 Rne/Rng family ribonuclease [Nonomuraea sp. G32]
MLDNEPNAGATGPDGETTEQTKVTARRRSASRPAGPPPELPEEPASVPVTLPAAQAAPSVAEGAPVQRTVVQRAAGEPDPDVLAAAAAATAGEAPRESTVESPVEGVLAEAVAEAEDKPKRATRTRSTATTPRRRTTKKAAEDQPEEAQALPEGAVPAEAEAAPVKRRRTTRKKAEPEETVAPEAPAAVDEAVAGETAGAGDVEAAAPRTGRTRTRAGRGAAARAAAGGDAGVGAEAAEAEGAAVSRPKAAEADASGAQAVVSGGDVEGEEDIIEILPEDEPLDDEPAGEDLDEELERPSLLVDPFGFAARTQDEAGGTAFQRPAAIFAPLFQAPDPSQAKPAVVRRPEPQPAAPEARPAEAEDVAEEAVSEEEADVDTSDEQEEEAGGRRRRRRRGGRGRGKARERDEAEDSEESEEETDEEQGEEAQDEEGSTSRRRRRRRRRGSDETPEPASDDPPNTVVRIRAPRSGRAASLDTATDGVQSVRGSTRLEAKKQRRREGRELGRRRPPIITESEFLARRESVDRMMVVRRQGDRTQIAVLEDGVLVEHYVNREASQSYVGNVYLGKVQNVLPSMEAAFVDIGKGRNAVLYAGEVNFDTAGMEGQPKRIESALKSGQSVLVQVTKDPIGHKGARLTSQISLPGRYLVYVPDGSMTGISRKLPDKERTRLKSILKKVMPENAGVIVRTAAEGASEDELARDVARLSAQWESIQKKAKSASPPELLSAEPDLTIRVVRDVFNEDFTSLVVQGEEAWDTVDDYVKYVAPHLGERLSRWDGEQGDGDVFESYRIDEQLGKALDRKVWLPSGGSLVIDRTEAMTVVDVNTGKFTGQGGNLEETVTRNNLEAAEEIVRQLRLRDIGGIIVIDFIDMVLESNRDLVLRRLLECLARDRTKHQVAEVTSLGLVQMTRKRVGQGLLEAFSTPCECCNGRGLLVSTEPVESKPEPRGTQGKMAVEKAVSDKVSAAKESAGRDTVTGALEDVPAEDDQAGQTSGRGRRRSRRAKSAE